MSATQATTSFQYTKEKNNFIRLCMLLIDLCSSVLRDILRKYIPETQLSNIIRNKSKLMRLTTLQRSLVFPPNSGGVYSGTYTEFDVTFLYSLIRNLCGLTHRKGWGNEPDPTDNCIAANVERLRLFRNEQFGHMSSMCVDDNTFRSTWAIVRKAVVELEHDIPPGQKSIHDNYQDEIDRLETLNLNTEHEERYVKLVVEQNNLATAVDKVTESLKRKADTTQLDDCDKRIKQLEDSREKNRVTPNSVRDNILRNTKARIEHHMKSDCYTSTAMVETVLQKMLTDKVVILSGKAGAGKTSLCIELLSRLSIDVATHEPRCIAIVNNADKWEHVVNCEEDTVVFIDDPIGKTNFDEGNFEKWEKEFDNMFASAMEGKVHIIIGIRSSVLNQSHTFLERYELFNDTHIIDMSRKEFDLSRAEKTDMMNKYIKHHTRHLSESKKQAIISIDTYYGFPYTCCLFFSKDSRFELGVDFFKHPKPLYTEIESLRSSYRSRYVKRKQHQYCILVYVLLFNEINKLRPNMKRIDEICCNLGFDKISISDVTNTIDDINGIYLTCDEYGDVYTFLHETILEAVFVSFGHLAPEIVIGFCSATVLRELIKPGYYKCKPDEVVLKIQPSHYYVLINRLIATDPFSRNFEKGELLNLIDEICEDAVFESLRKQINSDNEFEENLAMISDKVSLHFKFFVACRFNRYSLVKLLLSGDTSTDIKTEHKDTEESKHAELTERVGELPSQWVIMHSLYQSTTMGHIDTVKVILDYDSTLADFSYYGKKPYMSMMHVAATRNHVLLVEFLTSFKPDFRRTYDVLNTRTLLHDCVAQNCTAVLEFIFNFDHTLVNLTDRRNDTLICYAAMLELKETIKFLYKWKADVKPRDSNGKTLLHHCVDKNWYDVIECMIKDDPTLVSLTDIEGKSLISYADIRKRQAIVSLLGQYETDAECSHTFNRVSSLEKFIDNNCFDKLNSLIKNDPSIVDEMGTRGDSLIIYAATSGNKTMVQFLLQHKANCHRFDSSGFALLHYCVAQGWADVINEISKEPSDYEILTKTTKWSCIHIAAFFGRLPLVKKFEELGQHLTMLTDDGYDAFQIAMLALRYGPNALLSVTHNTYLDKDKHNYIIVSSLLGNEDDYKHLFKHIFEKCPCAVKDVCKPLDKDGNTLLHYLVLYDCKVLIDFVVESNRESVFKRNNIPLATVLHYATFMGRWVLVKKFWEAGVRPEDSDLSLTDIADSKIRCCGEQMNPLDMFMGINPLKTSFGSKEDFINIISFFVSQGL